MAKYNANLPPLNLPVLDETGSFTPYWHNVLLALYYRTGGGAGVNSAESIATANAAQSLAIAAKLTAAQGVTGSQAAQTSANAGINAANTAQASADAANAGIANINNTAVFKASFAGDGIAPTASPRFSGSITCSLLPQAPDDATAASRGVAVGQLYCNGSVVMQRQG